MFKALPAPDSEAYSLQQYEAPDGEVEQALAGIWRELLKIERIGRQDNFFALGGDSIRSLQLVLAAGASDISITVADVFAHQTIAELGRAARRSSNAPRQANLGLVNIPETTAKQWPSDITDVSPLSSMQALMVREYAGNTRHGLGIYHVQQIFRMRDRRSSAEAMRGALERVVAAHPMMRAVFIAGPDGAATLQAIRKCVSVELAKHDLSAMTEVDQENQLRAIALADRAQPFAVDSSTPQFRAHWFDLDSDRFELLLSTHHAVVDGWGDQIFLQELFHTYRCLRDGVEPVIVPRSHVYKEFVALEREAARSPEAAIFWRNRAFEPHGKERSQTKTSSPNRYGQTLTLTAETASAVSQLARRCRVSVKAVLLSAFRDALASHEGSRPPTIGVVTSGRSARLSDPLGALGLFWKLLPFQVQTNPSSMQERITSVQAELLAIEQHVLYPIDAIADAHGGADLFYATFNFVSFDDLREQLGESPELLNYRFHDKFHSPVNYFFSWHRGREVVGIKVEYDNAYFHDAEVEELNATLQRTINGYVK